MSYGDAESLLKVKSLDPYEPAKNAYHWMTFIATPHPLLTEQIKALKTLVWHLSSEPMKEISSLKKLTISNVWRTSADGQGKGLTISGTNWFGGWTPPVNWPPCIIHRSIRGGSQSTPPGDKAWCIIAPVERYGGYRLFQWKKKELQSSIHWFCYFHTLLLIIYLSAIERLTCRREMSLIGSTSFGFTQNTMHDFQNTVLNSW